VEQSMFRTEPHLAHHVRVPRFYSNFLLTYSFNYGPFLFVCNYNTKKVIHRQELIFLILKVSNGRNPKSYQQDVDKPVHRINNTTIC